jgi:hypothetical protein
MTGWFEVMFIPPVVGWKKCVLFSVSNFISVVNLEARSIFMLSFGELSRQN